MNRRTLLLKLALGTAVGAAAAIADLAGPQSARAQNPSRKISIVARRFSFEPSSVPVKVGERVLIEVTSLDFVHGFNVPALQTRHDLPPGQVTRFELSFAQAGEFDFLCDNFCGDGHEGMHGRFLVTA